MAATTASASSTAPAPPCAQWSDITAAKAPAFMDSACFWFLVLGRWVGGLIGIRRYMVGWVNE